MIITRSPLRISLGGGGTDLPSYYREHGGFLVAAAIDRYVYLTLHQTFVEDCIIKYSQMERVSSIDEIRHPIIREALRLTGTPCASLEIASMSDIPAGSGLGSSGSFTTALLGALHAFNHEIVTKSRLAEEACHIELEVLGEPIGKQDQFIAAYGGITKFSFNRDDSVTVEPVRLASETRANLQDNLVLFFTGYTRSASNILKDQDVRTKGNDRSMLDNLHRVKELGERSLQALEAGDLRGLPFDAETQNVGRRGDAGRMVGPRRGFFRRADRLFEQNHQPRINSLHAAGQAVGRLERSNAGADNMRRRNVFDGDRRRASADHRADHRRLRRRAVVERPQHKPRPRRRSRAVRKINHDVGRWRRRRPQFRRRQKIA